MIFYKFNHGNIFFCIYAVIYLISICYIFFVLIPQFQNRDSILYQFPENYPFFLLFLEFYHANKSFIFLSAVKLTFEYCPQHFQKFQFFNVIIRLFSYILPITSSCLSNKYHHPSFSFSWIVNAELSFLYLT